jgi:pyruvate, orthophosphate dikinase
MEPEGPARRQGGEPRRDDLGARPPGPPRLHHHHRRLPRVHGRGLARWSRRRRSPSTSRPREEDGPQARRPDDPLLVSVRSGAKFSMPGMMDTVLNLGLNDESGRGPGHPDRDERFAYDSYRRFIAMYGRIVLGLEGEHFDDPLEKAKERGRRPTPTPSSPPTRSKDALRAVQGSWSAGHRQAVPAGPARAAARRHRGGVPSRGTVPGPSPTGCASASPRPRHRRERADDGVRQPRRPLGHRRGLHPQRGHRREQALRRLPRERPGRGRGGRHPQHRGPRRARDHFPGIHEELLDIFERLEAHYRDMCDTEFTIEQGKLWMLQTRVGKRTGAAALRMAVDMTKGPRTSIAHLRAEAVQRSPPSTSTRSCTRSSTTARTSRSWPPGLAPSPGAAVGKRLLHRRRRRGGPRAGRARSSSSAGDLARGRARHAGRRGHPHLARRPGEPRRRGGPRLGHPGRVGAEAIKINGKQFTVGRPWSRGRRDLPRRHHRRGRARRGHLSAAEPPPSSTPSSGGPTRSARASWGAGQRRHRADAANARQFGAEGIGLCRTEHMFLGRGPPAGGAPHDPRHTPTRRSAPSSELREVQKADFEEILEAMDGLPVTVRLLDPPLHEFLPNVQELEIKKAVARGKLRRRRGELLAAARDWRSSTRCSAPAACASAW